MSVPYIIKKSLEEYDSVKPVLRYLNKHTSRTMNITKIDTKRSTMKFIDDNNEILFETEIEIFAIYYSKFNIWSWAWGSTIFKTAETYLSKKMLMHALTLDTEMTYIKSILTTSRGIVRDTAQLDINIAIGASIIKQPYIYPAVTDINDSKYIIYYILFNKEALDKLKGQIGKDIEPYDDDDQGK